MYICTQIGDPIVIMHFCHPGDWSLVGFFIAEQRQPASRQRYLTFSRLMHKGC
jgi:hypothetical protein